MNYRYCFHLICIEKLKFYIKKIKFENVQQRKINFSSFVSFFLSLNFSSSYFSLYSELVVILIQFFLSFFYVCVFLCVVVLNNNLSTFTGKLEIFHFILFFFILIFFVSNFHFLFRKVVIYGREKTTTKCSRLGSNYSLAIWTLTHSSCTNITQNIMITRY